MKHILSVDQFSRAELDDLIRRAIYYWRSYHYDKNLCSYPLPSNLNGWIVHNNQNYRPTWTIGKILSNLFYEPSTRTSSSFYSAMVRLGGSVIPINEAEKYSSAIKGESLEDSILTMGCYSDVIVLRHKEVGAADRAAAVSQVPIINAGDGVGEHPTQALLDLLTILIERGIIPADVNLGKQLGSQWWKVYPSLDFLLHPKFELTVMGDLKHGRTVKSLVKLVRVFEDIKVNFVSPEELKIPEEFVGSFDVETTDLNNVIETTDVLYVTRVQKERIEGNSNFEYGVTLEHMAKAKPNMVLMHPLPRVNEIPKELDNDPRSAYFRQMLYGLYMRMAILEYVLQPEW